MTEHNPGQPKRIDAFGTITQALVENETFKLDFLGKNKTKAANFLDRHIRSLKTSEHRDLGIFILHGISLGTQLWDVSTQKVALAIFSQIALPRGDELNIFKDTYLNAVSRQKTSNETQSAEALLQISHQMSPFFLRTAQPFFLIEMQEAWDTAVADKQGSWESINEQADKMITDLGFQFIDQLYTKKTAMGPPLRPSIIKRRKEVFRHRKKSAREAAEIINGTVPDLPEIKPGNVEFDRHWLTERELLEPVGKKRGKRHAPKYRGVETTRIQAEKIKENGISDVPSELERIVLYFLQGVSIRKITKVFKSANNKIKILQEVGVIPKKSALSDVRALNAYNNSGGNYTYEQIAEYSNVPVEIVRLITSIPENKHALDELPQRGDIYHK